MNTIITFVMMQFDIPLSGTSIKQRLYSVTQADMNMNYLLYSVVAFGLTVVLGIIAFTIYLSTVRRKYAHIPCPRMDK